MVHLRITNFTNFILNNFSRLLTNDIFIYGDFNIDISRTNYNNILYFIDSISSLRIFQLINIPTRNGDYSNTIIDYIFTNCKTSPEIVGLFITYMSDHLPIFSIYNILFTSNLIPTKQKYILFIHLIILILII